MRDLVTNSELSFICSQLKGPVCSPLQPEGRAARWSQSRKPRCLPELAPRSWGRARITQCSLCPSHLSTVLPAVTPRALLGSVSAAQTLAGMLGMCVLAAPGLLPLESFLGSTQPDWKDL